MPFIVFTEIHENCNRWETTFASERVHIVVMNPFSNSPR